MPPNRTGLLIIRAWVEQGSSKPLRVHIRFSTDIAAGFESEVTLTDTTDVCTAVEMWLKDVLTAGQLPDNLLPDNGQVTVTP